MAPPLLHSFANEDDAALLIPISSHINSVFGVRMNGTRMD
jgi:hypothetical protein